MYLDKQEYKISEKRYNEALEIRRRLTSRHPEIYEPDLAKTLSSLGNLYSAMHKYEASEKKCNEALKIYRRLASKNSDAYDSGLSRVLCVLGLLYHEQHKYDVSERNYNEALGIYRRHASRHPEIYNPVVAGLLGNMSDLEVFLKNFVLSQKYAEEGLSIDSTQHCIYINLAASLLLQGKCEDANKIYMKIKAEFKQNIIDKFFEYEILNIIPNERKVAVEEMKTFLNQ